MPEASALIHVYLHLNLYLIELSRPDVSLSLLHFILLLSQLLLQFSDLPLQVHGQVALHFNLGLLRVED